MIFLHSRVIAKLSLILKDNYLTTKVRKRKIEKQLCITRLEGIFAPPKAHLTFLSLINFEITISTNCAFLTSPLTPRLFPDLKRMLFN